MHDWVNVVQADLKQVLTLYQVLQEDRLDLLAATELGLTLQGVGLC